LNIERRHGTHYRERHRGESTMGERKPVEAGRMIW
jgi:hypothetical protein